MSTLQKGTRGANPGSVAVHVRRAPSILDLDGEAAVDQASAAPPDFFPDLNLDQVVGAAIADLDEFDLAPVYHRPLRSVDAVVYRQEVARDLEDADRFARVAAFADTMGTVRSRLDLSAKNTHTHQSPRWFLSAASAYVDAVLALTRVFTGDGIGSRGLRAAGEYLADYTASPAFMALHDDVRAVLTEIEGLRYHMVVDSSSVRVSTPEGETDYAADVLASFERFRQSEAKPEPAVPTEEEMVQMGAFSTKVLNLVTRVYPEAFAALTAFAIDHEDFLDSTVVALDRELHFYLGYLSSIAPLRATGLPFAYPTMNATSKNVDAAGAFDLALAHKLVSEGTEVVRNDVKLGRGERILVVTGPNQGGKTTYARMFGQLHYLASLGLPVPARRARLFLFDQMLTYFDREETLADGVGKLEDELVRIRTLLETATPRSIIVLNEMFTSTTVDDASAIGSYVLRRIAELDALCVCVTFIDAFSSLTPSTVSLMSTVDADDATLRTFSIVRKPADGLAYAAAIAAKHRLDHTSIRGRLAR